VRGRGGYVLLPPSPHENGTYEWRTAPDETPLAPAPAWLLELLAVKRASAIVPESEGERPLIPIGQRHSALVRFLGLLRSMGFGETALVAFCGDFLDHCVEVDEARCPLDRTHAEATARDVARRYSPHRTNGDRP
jgi:hypothetical protein